MVLKLFELLGVWGLLAFVLYLLGMAVLQVNTLEQNAWVLPGLMEMVLLWPVVLLLGVVVLSVILLVVVVVVVVPRVILLLEVVFLVVVVAWMVLPGLWGLRARLSFAQ